MDHGRNRGDDDQHHGGKLIDAHRPGGAETAGLDPGEQFGRARHTTAGHVEEDDPGQHHGQQHQAGGDVLRGMIAQTAIAETDNERAQQRKGDDGDVDIHVSPSSC